MERGPAPDLTTMKPVNVQGNLRFQDRETNKFISNDDAIAAVNRAEDILNETVHELGDVSHGEYSTMRGQLGLGQKHDHWKGGSALFDKESALKTAEDRVNNPDGEEIQSRELANAEDHDEKQSFYEEFFGGMSDEEIATKSEGLAYKRNQKKLTEKHNAEIAERAELNAKKNELKNATNLNSMGITQLAALLGEKPSFNTSKADYIKRVKESQSELNDNTGANVLIVPEPNPSESTLATIEAIKKFHKGELASAKSDDDSGDDEPELFDQDNEDEDELTGGIPAAANLIWADDEPVDANSDEMFDSNGTPVGPGSLAGSAIDRRTDPANRPTKEKKSWRKRIAIGAIALAGLFGASALLANSGGENANEGPDTTELNNDAPEATSPLNMDEALDALGDDSEDEADTTEASSEEETESSSPLNMDDVLDELAPTEDEADTTEDTSTEDAESTDESTEVEETTDIEENADSDTESSSEETSEEEDATTTAEADPLAGINGVENIDVESGNGFTTEIQQFAKANGAEISPEQAYAIYQAGLEQFGPNGLITGGVYEMSPGNYGILEAGNNNFTPEFAQFMNDRLPSNS